MIIVSYYTKNYAACAIKLLASLDKFGLEHHVEPMDGLGSWRRNCGMKPTFLLRMLDHYKRPVMWVDADAIIQKPFEPELFEATEHADFGAWFIPNKEMRKPDIPGGPDSGADGIASGTMVWNHTPAAIGLLLLWQEMDTHDNGRYEQKVLGEAWLRAEQYGHVRTLRLPQRYTKVMDSRWFDCEEGPAIIEHFQASRTLRNVEG